MPNVIPFPVIPRKPADRVGQIYRCSWRRCGREVTISGSVGLNDVCPDCAAEMRPVEMEAK